MGQVVDVVDGQQLTTIPYTEDPEQLIEDVKLMKRMLEEEEVVGPYCLSILEDDGVWHHYYSDGQRDVGGVPWDWKPARRKR